MERCSPSPRSGAGSPFRPPIAGGRAFWKLRWRNKSRSRSSPRRMRPAYGDQPEERENLGPPARKRGGGAIGGVWSEHLPVFIAQDGGGSVVGSLADALFNREAAIALLSVVLALERVPMVRPLPAAPSPGARLPPRMESAPLTMAAPPAALKAKAPATIPAVAKVWWASVDISASRTPRRPPLEEPREAGRREMAPLVHEEALKGAGVEPRAMDLYQIDQAICDGKAQGDPCDRPRQGRARRTRWPMATRTTCRRSDPPRHLSAVIRSHWRASRLQRGWVGFQRVRNPPIRLKSAEIASPTGAGNPWVRSRSSRLR